MSSKAWLRADLRAARMRFTATLGPERARVERDLCGRLSPLLAGVEAVAFYCAVGAEVDVSHALASAGTHVECTMLPFVADPAGPMRFLRWSPGDPLFPGPYGIAQPAPDAEEIAPAVIMAPLVGFTRSGARLGQGGGFYDRAFAAYPGVRRIGAAWSVQEIDSLPLDPWDMPLHAIVTEREVIEVTA